jgi:two-component system nitrogen regulation response regulator NtrX
MKLNILIVDDEAPIRDLLSEFFKKHGYQTYSAATAEEAIHAADDVPLNLVIQDIALAEADADGLQLLSKMKATHPNLPVLMLTGLGFDDELLQEALQKGASGYVSKTLPLDHLLMEVHRITKHNKSA